jgi:ATP-binding cassette, subfamily B, bacterial
MFKKFITYIQLDSMDCGPTCLRMVAKHFGKEFSLEYLRHLSYITREGVSLLGISEAAEKVGLKTLAAAISFDQLNEEVNLPCVLHWNQNHFVVVPPQNYNPQNPKATILIADPTTGLVKVDKTTFLKCWLSKANKTGIALLFEPTPSFYDQEEREKETAKGLWFLMQYLKPYRRYVVQLMLSMLLGSLLSLLLPFLTQSLVDYGVSHQNLGFITLILLSQLVLFIGSVAVEMIRSWILVHMNSRINISIISDFLIKLMKLPIKFFDTKMIGDITQRINDHKRIEQFLTNNTLSTVFSLLSLLVYVIVLGSYNLSILGVFIVGSILSIGWIIIFLKKRKSIDYKRFQESSNHQSNLYELITGMQEIKLNNCETQKRWQWERIQAKLFKLSLKSLALEQYQQTGNMFFSKIKNIFISYITAMEVVKGNMSLGMMLSVSYIIGQMDGPLDQLLNFFKSGQDAKISLERIGEIYDQPNEEKVAIEEDTPIAKPSYLTNTANAALTLPHLQGVQAGDIVLQNVSFQYAGPNSALVLNDVCLTLPKGTVTAIVGASGSGKTTLMKLLLQFYEPTSGKITIGPTELAGISPRWWRGQCGVVMQEGYIFSDTIARNIAVTGEKINEQKLLHAVKVANIENYINELPLGYTTKIGNAGNGISGGQKQRILIARAVYKDPQYLFFDEATSALDANNEKTIMDNLDQFFEGKTVMVVAHRLSTVKNADQIIVMENGKIVETGNHYSLTQQKGKYYELVKNQLELGS